MSLRSKLLPAALMLASFALASADRAKVWHLQDRGDAPPGTIGMKAAMARASDSFETIATQPEDMALLHFTSGTTGQPKGVMHVHGAVLVHPVTARYALGLQDGVPALDVELLTVHDERHAAGERDPVGDAGDPAGVGRAPVHTSLTRSTPGHCS